MVRPDRDKLDGIVEVDETSIGGERPGKRGRGAENKTLVIIAVEDTIQCQKPWERNREDPPGRVDDASSKSLIKFIKTNGVPGSTIRTEGWLGYKPLVKTGYKHSVAGSKDHTIVHLVAALLKRLLLGTFHGAVTQNHLDYFLDEYTFSFNRRKSASRGKLFYRMVQQAVIADPVLGSDITGGKGKSAARFTTLRSINSNHNML